MSDPSPSIPGQRSEPPQVIHDLPAYLQARAAQAAETVAVAAYHRNGDGTGPYAEGDTVTLVFATIDTDDGDAALCARTLDLIGTEADPELTAAEENPHAIAYFLRGNRPLRTGDVIALGRTALPQLGAQGYRPAVWYAIAPGEEFEPIAPPALDTRAAHGTSPLG